MGPPLVQHGALSPKLNSNRLCMANFKVGCGIVFIDFNFQSISIRNQCKFCERYVQMKSMSAIFFFFFPDVGKRCLVIHYWANGIVSETVKNWIMSSEWVTTSQIRRAWCWWESLSWSWDLEYDAVTPSWMSVSCACAGVVSVCGWGLRLVSEQPRLLLLWHFSKWYDATITKWIPFSDIIAFGKWTDLHGYKWWKLNALTDK